MPGEEGQTAVLSLQEQNPGVSLGTSSAIEKCRISRNGGVAYCTSQNSFEVVDVHAGHAVSRGKFQDEHGAALTITCFVEAEIPLDPESDDDSVARRTAPVIVLGLYNELNRKSHVRVISPDTWNVLHTSQVPIKPSNLAVIGFTEPLKSSVFPAQQKDAQVLQFTFAVIAGDAKGSLVLVDLPFRLSDIDPDAPESDVPVPPPHAPISLSEKSESKWKYALSGADSVTSMYYMEVLHTLAVGFSFGGVQLWDVLTLSLMSETPREDNRGPVTHFLFQQLEHDDCSRHLWACHGSTTDKVAPVTLDLYRAEGRPGQWSLDRKRTEALSGASGAGRILSADSLVEKSLQSDSHMLAAQRDGGLRHGVVVWQQFLNGGQSRYELVLIDLGMLESLPDHHGGRMTQAEEFAATHFATRHDITSESDIELLDMFVDPYSVFDWQVLGADAIRSYDTEVRSVFLGLSDTMSFSAQAVGQRATYELSFKSRSDQVLSQLAETAPAIFADEEALSQVFTDCWVLGLIHDHPRSENEHEDPTALSQPDSLTFAEKRWEVFNLALERGLVSSIVQYVTALRPSVNAEGRPLTDTDFLLPTPLTVWKWASETFARWNTKLARLYEKTSPDMSTAERGRRMAEIEFVLGCLKSLSLVFNALLQRQPPRPVDAPPGPLEQDILRHQAELFQANLLSWFIGVGLLPLDSRGERLFTDLPAVFERRRQRARDAAGSNNWHVAGMRGYRAPSTSLDSEPALFIDRIVASLGPVGSAQFGTFPPVSHEPLIRLFASAPADDPCHMERLCIVLYFLLEVQSTPTTPVGEAQSVLDRFRHAFGMPLSYERMVLGMWALDSGQDPADACAYFTDPATELVWTNVILKTLYTSGGHEAALKLYRTIPMDLTTVDDVTTVVKVLTASQLFSEAYQLLRKFTADHPDWAEPLLWHLFAAVQTSGRMPELFTFPLDDPEEGFLVEFLQGCGVPGALDALMVYYLQRSRFAEAIRLHEFLMSQPGDLSDPQRVRTRTDLITNYRLLMPAVQERQLAVDLAREDVAMAEAEFSPAVAARSARAAHPAPMAVDRPAAAAAASSSHQQSSLQTPPRTPFLHSRVNQFLQSDAVFAAPPSSMKRRSSTKKIFNDVQRAVAPGTPVAAFGFSQRVEPEVRRLSYGDALVSPSKAGANAHRGGVIQTSPPPQPRWGQSPPPSTNRNRSPQKTPRSILRQRKRPATAPATPGQSSRGGIVWDDKLEHVKEISPNVKKSPEPQSSPLTDLGPPPAASNPFIARRSKLATPPKTLGFAGLPDDDEEEGNESPPPAKAKPARRSVGFAGLDSSSDDEQMDTGSPAVPARSGGVRFAADPEPAPQPSPKKKPARKSVGFTVTDDDDGEMGGGDNDAAGASDDTLPTGSPQAIPTSPLVQDDQPRRRSARLNTGGARSVSFGVSFAGDDDDAAFQDPDDNEIVVSPPANQTRTAPAALPNPFEGMDVDSSDDEIRPMTPAAKGSTKPRVSRKAPPKASKPAERKPATQKYNLRSKKAAPAS